VERRVKERLVGAAVLIAAAIILNEAMLSDPGRDERAAVARPSSDTPLKTYTIDLNRSPGSQSTSAVDERVPPPEVLTPAQQQAATDATPVEPSENPTPAPQAVPERTAPTPQSIASDQPRSAESAPVPLPSPTRPANPREPEVAQPIASAPAAPTSRGWAVQLGSFASRATADRMVKDLSQQGQNAFVMPVKSGSSTLYRVRIGPFAQRAAANEALGEVKGRVANAAVVAHP
jgi:DedD protein